MSTNPPTWRTKHGQPRVFQYPNERSPLIDSEDWTNGPVEGSVAEAVQRFRKVLQGRRPRDIVKLWGEIEEALWAYASRMRHRTWTVQRVASYGIKPPRKPLIPGWSHARLLWRAMERPPRTADQIHALVQRYGLPSLLAIIGLHEAFAGWGEGVTDAAFRLSRVQEIERAHHAARTRREKHLEVANPARELACKLYAEGNYKTKKQAVRNIAPKIREAFPDMALADSTVERWLPARWDREKSAKKK